MIAGGKAPGETITDTVMEYDIEANEYKIISSLPQPLYYPTLVYNEGFVYKFGGKDESFDFVNEVARIPKNLSIEWRGINPMKTPYAAMTVIPYNN